MAINTESLESPLIDAVCARIRERAPVERAAQCEAFARQYYHWVPPDDLADRDPDDLYGAALAHWTLALERGRGEAKVRVYNPDPETDGWSSPHTVIQIVSDDMPFVVDSVTMELGRAGYRIDLVIHPVMNVRRNAAGRLIDVLDPGAEGAEGAEREPGPEAAEATERDPGAEAEPTQAIAESVLHAEVTRERDADARERLRAGVERVLDEVRSAVADWGAMRSRVQEIVDDLEAAPPPVDPAELEEGKALLRWLADDRFTFLGYREYGLTRRDGETRLEAHGDTGLGILRGTPIRPYTALTGKRLELARAPHLLLITKANSRSTVHRPAYLDYIGVRSFSPDGEVLGERRFLGLFSHTAYRESPQQIPLLRGRVTAVLDRAGFPPGSHDAKGLTEILEDYPRDWLFQTEADELFEIAMGILGLGERQRLRLFVRRDPLGRFVACTVCMPRDRYNTQNRERIGAILAEEFDGGQVDWSVQISESLLVRIHYTVRCTNGIVDGTDVKEIEARLIRAIRAWTDDLSVALEDEFGEEQGETLFRRYRAAFPPTYRDDWPARAAVGDSLQLERLAADGGPIIDLYRPVESHAGEIRCKLFSSRDVALSDVLPTFEHMGTRVVDERPYEISPQGSEPVWIYDFGLLYEAQDLERVKEPFEQAFLGAWRGELEDDGLGALVLGAGLTGREITIVRAVSKYLRQAGIAFSDAYMERTLLRHPEIARLLVDLFKARFDPDRPEPESAARLEHATELAIDSIPSLDEDRILRSFLAVLRAIVRTNYFREGDRDFLAFKLESERVPLLARPRPQFEIFVYSPRVEGLHLRGGRVARGGIRWSDRPEDFRTEILGLMKAQMVKNALIVPVGSKGGFVVKRPPVQSHPARAREALQAEAIECYRTFLCGLLDLTDNIVSGEVVPPARVVCYDEEDPYLVVAADKGTAAFSDIANAVAADYGFWLGDAFASGGSRGYDHKAMGITARGAWESVKRHFRELGTDIQTTDFTVAGIGDMSGDVFGNGMLLSRHIRLVAAFNHLHIFLDPDPDPERSYAERRRLFELPRSAWSDYERSLISDGGGVYERTAKSIPISAQVREVLELDADELSPGELISAILRAPVDLLFNGGIGTYVKASSETHGEVGDKANDAVRVDGRALRCRVVAEGGNLGLTELGRAEYALQGGPDGNGGRINTDAIDNVAGVNTSDHEVNIKILLDSLVSSGELTQKQRDELLAEMTDAVAERVLYGSYTQTQAMSLELVTAGSLIDAHTRLIHQLEQVAGLDRELEFLPPDETISEREADHRGLLAPELAVVMAYCKIHLYAELLRSDLPEDPYLGHDLERYFPPPLPERYAVQMRAHRLRREIIATVVANQLVDRAGTTFSFRLGEETGTPASMLARAYAVAREAFAMRSFWEQVEALDNVVEARTQLELLIEGRRLVERASRWLVRAHPHEIAIERTTGRYAAGVKLLSGALPGVLDGSDREAFDSRVAELRAAGVPAPLARRVAELPHLVAVFDIVEVAATTGREPEAVMRTYFILGAQFVLIWLRDRILELPRSGRWQALSRAAMRDDLSTLHRALTQQVLQADGAGADPDQALELWRQRNQAALQRMLGMLDEIKASRVYDVTTLGVALREVRNLIGEGEGEGPNRGA